MKGLKMRYLWIALTAAALSLASLTAFAGTPNSVIEESVALLTEGLDGRKAELAADRPALYKLINSILLPRFDREFAARVVLAKHWRTASAEQKDRFIEAFYQSLMRRYADGVLEFDPSKFTVLPFRGDATKNRTKVRSTVVLDDGSKVAVDYDLVKRDADWLVFNVAVEGVSYVINYRAELDSEIGSSSLDAVINRLEKEAGISAGE